MRYFDRNGKEIKEGSYVRFSDGRVERAVYLEDESLGYDAVNPAYRKRHPDVENEYYSFSAVAKEVNGEWAFVVDGLLYENEVSGS